MRTYETTFIINPQTDDASIEKSVASVSEVITENGGKILHEDRMGTRRLAYPIKGLTQGYYTSFIFEGPTEVLPALDRHFKMNEIYIRNLTILYEGDVKALMEQKEDTAPEAAATPEAPATAETAAAPAETAVSEEAAPTPESATETAPQEAGEPEATSEVEGTEPPSEEETETKKESVAAEQESSTPEPEELPRYDEEEEL